MHRRCPSLGSRNIPITCLRLSGARSRCFSSVLTGGRGCSLVSAYQLPGVVLLPWGGGGGARIPDGWDYSREYSISQGQFLISQETSLPLSPGASQFPWDPPAASSLPSCALLTMLQWQNHLSFLSIISQPLSLSVNPNELTRSKVRETVKLKRFPSIQTHIRLMGLQATCHTFMSRTAA